MIITSATLDPAVFREYYKGIDRDIPLIQIPGRTFPVDRKLDAESSLIDEVVMAYRNWENILVFEAWKKEIELEIEKLRTILWPDAQIFPLHAEMPKEEQEKLLKKDPNDRRPRIIVATNVAEESITIDYIDRVVDSARYKVSRYNEAWIPGLYLEDIPMSSVKQRSWRVWRTHPWIYSRHSDTPFNELPEYGDAPIEKEMLDQHILMLLAEGYDMRTIIDEAKSRGESPFYHRFDVWLLRISYERLKQIGAITKNGALTELGYTLLRYPLDVYYGRMLHESIDRSCVDEMMIIVSILEKKGFLSKEDTWKNLGIVKPGTSDLAGYTALFRFFTATEITPKQAEKLKEFWANPDEVDDFMTRRHSKNNPRLFEIVDLTPIGVKKARIKAVYDKYLELQKRFEMLEIPITTGKDKNAIAISIATWSPFFLYSYNDEEGWFISQKQSGSKDADIFRMGDISLVEPEDGARYIGQPFIIWPKDESSSWMRLLSFITQVDDAIIKEAQATNARYAKAEYSHEEWNVHHAGILEWTWNQGGGSGGVTQAWARSLQWQSTAAKGSPHRAEKLAHYPDIALGEETYANSLEQLYDAPFTSDEASRDYYLRYCLPLFLIEHNQAIRKYIKWKSPEWVAIFRELLTRFVLDEAQRIRLQNLEVTERSFRYDSWILQRFEESNDFHIRYFRIHGMLPEIRGPKEGAPKESDFDILDYPDEDIEGMRKQYAKRLGWANRFSVAIDSDSIEEQYFTSRVLAISEWDGTEEEIGAYAVIKDIYDSVGRLDQVERGSMSRWLKKMSSQKKDIDKLAKKIWGLQVVYDALSMASDLRYRASSLRVHQKVLHDAWKIFEDFWIWGSYNQALQRAFSDDSKKRKRGANALKWYRTALGGLIHSHSERKRELEGQLSFAEFPQLRTLWDTLNRLAASMYQGDYLRLRIQPKMLETLRALVRDYGTERLWMDALLTNFIYHRQSGNFLVDDGVKFQEIREYLDAWEVIENHQMDIAEEVKKSDDAEYIRLMLKKLEEAIWNLEESHKKLKRNPIYKKFQESVKA